MSLNPSIERATKSFPSHTIDYAWISSGNMQSSYQHKVELSIIDVNWFILYSPHGATVSFAFGYGMSMGVYVT